MAVFSSNGLSMSVMTSIKEIPKNAFSLLDLDTPERTHSQPLNGSHTDTKEGFTLHRAIPSLSVIKKVWLLGRAEIIFTSEGDDIYGNDLYLH